MSTIVLSYQALSSRLLSNAPSRRCGFPGGAIYRPFLQHTHGFRDSSFELWITSGDDVFGPVLDLDIGPHTFVLNRPATVAREEATARRDHRSAINKGRRISRMN